MRTAKSCVVPTKVHTVPRLELMGSVLLAFEKVLKVTKVVSYSDSQIVLWWLKLIRRIGSCGLKTECKLFKKM